jgi:hypothetical protein
MISHTHRCIFIHIPKTAGTSIEKKLDHFDTVRTNVQDHRSLRELEPFAWHQLANLANFADPYLLKRIRNRVQGHPAPTREEYGSYFKFSFVRNSWSRVFSWYRNVMTNENHKRERGISSELDFKEFLLRFPAEWGTRSQLYWLQDSHGDVPLDFIGRFERLETDFGEVGRRLGLPDAKLPRLVVGEGKTYTDFYDQETVDLVGDRYRKEIDMFGFEFGE